MTIGPEGEKSESEKSEQIKEEHEACPEGYFWNEISQSCRKEEEIANP